MRATQAEFLKVLFRPEEATCFANSVKVTQVTSLKEFAELIEGQPDSALPVFFSINPMDVNSKRSDEAVTSFRNFLLEFDNIPLEKQRSLGDKIPYSSEVFSGNKSIHYIISLETPLKTREEYDAVARRLMKAFPEADKSTKNPSRLSRFPGAHRPGGKEQLMLHMRGPVANDKFFLWLDKLAPVDDSGSKPRTDWTSIERSLGGINVFTRDFLQYGAEPGVWNITLFQAACDMVRNGFGYSDICAAMECITGHLDNNDKASIRSAVKTAGQNGD